jgi:serine/threonine protein kinase
MPIANPTGSSEQALGLLVEELTAKLQAGEPVDVEACIQEHPQYAEQLRHLLPALEMLADLGHSAVASHGKVAAVAAPADEILGTLGDFRILREIGRGGMGVVYEAVQISLNRRVALKVLPFAASLDAKQLQRFKNESQAAAQLHHTNIVPVFGVGCERGVHFYAMQYIEGQTLASVIQDLRKPASLSRDEATGPYISPAHDAVSEQPAQAPFSPSRQGGASGAADAQRTTPYVPEPLPAEAPAGETSSLVTAILSTEHSIWSRRFFRTVAQVGVQSALALEHAHQFGVIHRDIKPANLLLDARGSVWVTDFGLAHCQNQAGLTMTGDLVGTLRYMSPEQALAKRVPVDHRTDIYSLGVTLYEFLTQEFAFPGKDRQEVLQRIAFEEPRPPRRLNNGIPAELETIVLKAMAKSPAERYATAQELADDLQRFLEDKPIKARRSTIVQRIRKWARRKPALAGVVALTGLALLLSAGSLGLVVLSAQLKKAVDEKDVALGQAEEAQRNEEKQRQKAEALNNTLQILLASEAWQEGELSLCEQHLEACQAEFRQSWE